MTVESDYAIAIATLSDWLKRLVPVFQPVRSTTKTNGATYAWFFPRFFPRFERVADNGSGIVIGSLCCLFLLWLVGIIALVLVFRQSFESRSNTDTTANLPFSIFALLQKIHSASGDLAMLRNVLWHTGNKTNEVIATVYSLHTYQCFLSWVPFKYRLKVPAPGK